MSWPGTLSELYCRTSLLYSCCGSAPAGLPGVRRSRWICSAGRSHVCRLKWPAYRGKAALRQNFHCSIDGNMDAAIGRFARAAKPIVFRIAERAHVVLVVILQARSFNRAAEMLVNLAASVPIRGRLDFPF